MPRKPDKPAAAAPPRRGIDLPPWFPPWARTLAEHFYAQTACLFVLHGNVHDLIHVPDGAAAPRCGLLQFLGTQLFGSWDLVLEFDLAEGLRPLTGLEEERRLKAAQFLAAYFGERQAWPAEPDKALLFLDRLFEGTLPNRAAAPGKVALVIDYAQYVVPAADLGTLARGQGVSLVRLLNWAQNPEFKRRNVVFCLIADRLADLNDRLVQSPHVVSLEVPMPTAEERERFCQAVAAGADDFAQWTEFSPKELAAVANGLSLHSLDVVLAQGKYTGQRVDAARFRGLKKTLIERQCRGLLEFVEPKHTLDLVVGLEAAKDRLKQDAALVARGQLDAAPMGYLLCGPVGTGKTFLAECYAGSIGIPCVKLRNFRSKYVGETEGNLEQVLTVLRSLGPVVVLIDEADAALGNREQGGDSGTSSRVFSMIASQMGDTQYRGRIIWMLLTSRPDLLPIDLKRQGRAEVHLPLFYPQTDEEVRTMFTVLARKNKVPLAADAVPEVKAERHLSGSDIESILLGAWRTVLAGGGKEVTRKELQEAVEQFIPSAQGLEKEMQELAAVLECTQFSFLPAEWRARVAAPDGRAKLQERFVALRQLLEER